MAERLLNRGLVNTVRYKNRLNELTNILNNE